MDDTIRADDLAELERRIVRPVARAFLAEDELEAVTLSRDEPVGGDAFFREPGSVWVRITAHGEDFDHMLLMPGVEETYPDDEPEQGEWDGTYDTDELANRMYHDMWDWVVETRFSWGTPRDGDYIVPPAAT